MKISVIVPTKRYGGLDIILSSLGGQIGLDKEDWEVIIIDDFLNGDVDNGDRKNECLSYCKKFDVLNIVYLRSKIGYWRSNHSIGCARNTGLIYAKGELIVFVDDYSRLSPSFLEEHWKMYEISEGKYTLLGGGVCTEIISFDNEYDYEFIRNGIKYKQLPVFEDTRMQYNVKEDCGGGWFYTFNASVLLEKIIDVNGFDEEFDLTREEDIDLGLRLEKVGCRFYYKFDPKCNIVQVDHRFVDLKMKKESSKRYKDITYDMLRIRCRSGKNEGKVIESEKDEVQLVLKEKYGTMYDGSWGLHEKRRNNGTYFGNVDNGLVTFDLRKERRNVKEGKRIGE